MRDGGSRRLWRVGAADHSRAEHCVRTPAAGREPTPPMGPGRVGRLELGLRDMAGKQPDEDEA